MARVSLIDGKAGPDTAAVAARVLGARGGRLLNLYRVLLHSPALAGAWLDFNSAVRFKTSLDDRLRELAIVRIACLNGADYVVGIHRERYAEAARVSRAEVDALKNWIRSRRFAPRERAMLRYTDAMTRDVKVSAAVFRVLRRHFDERRVVELTVLIAAYNMHTRVLKALDVDPETA
jgi:4-carboxymuconolactone decarboxylase